MTSWLGRGLDDEPVRTSLGDEMTAQTTQPTELDQMGPIDYLVVEFPPGRVSGEALPLLVDLVDRKIIRILDFAFVRKQPDGSVVTLTDVDLDRMQLIEAALFDGAASGLLDMDDLEEVSTALEPGAAAGVLIYENRWAEPFASALRRSGAQLVATGRIPIQDLVAALDATEPTA
jgi:hypothetical protein